MYHPFLLYVKFLMTEPISNSMLLPEKLKVCCELFSKIFQPYIK